MDTHTAVAYAAAEKYRAESGTKNPMVIVSTASPYKFTKDVMTALDEKYADGDAFALMKEMEERGRQKDVTIFFLEVRESNDAARRLYEKMGYEQIGVRKNFYEKPAENAIIMSKGWRTA